MHRAQYQLQYGYMHCVGRTTYIAGTVDTLEAARKWVRTQTAAAGRMRTPEDDPVKWCPVRHCHMKRQKPWFGYRKIVKSGKQEDRPDFAAERKVMA